MGNGCLSKPSVSAPEEEQPPRTLETGSTTPKTNDEKPSATLTHSQPHSVQDSASPEKATVNEQQQTVSKGEPQETAPILVERVSTKDSTESEEATEPNAETASINQETKQTTETVSPFEKETIETVSPAETSVAAKNHANEQSMMIDEPEDIDDHSFRFMSANQLLQLKTLSARQLLPFDTTKHDPIDDERHQDTPALAFVFVSHRWMEPGNPDANGQQLKALQMLIEYTRDLLQVTLLPRLLEQQREEQYTGTAASISWSSELKQLREGMPQAAALVSRILADPKLEQTLQHIRQTCTTPADLHEVDLMDYVWFWYDCACLPQKYEGRPQRTKNEQSEFAWALSRLDQLALNCEMVYLTDDTYFGRAWCAFEHFQRSLVNLRSHIKMECSKVIEQEPVEFQLNEVLPPKAKRIIKLNFGGTPKSDKNETPGPDKKIETKANLGETVDQQMKKDQELANATHAAAKESSENQKSKLYSQRLDEFSKAEEQWKDFLASSKEQNKVIDSLVDLQLLRVKLDVWHKEELAINKRDNSSPEADARSNPLFQSMSILVRELFMAVFSMSCRDALDAANAASENESNRDTACKFQPSIVIPARSHSCPSDVGISCGLHDHQNLGCDLLWASAHLRMRIATPLKDLKLPDEMEEPLCERRVTIDFHKLASDCLGKLNLKCTNSGDIAFVGLMALRNILSRDGGRGGHIMLQTDAGALTLLTDAISQMVNTYSHMLAAGMEVDKLVATVKITAPRWVHLDLAHSIVEINEHITGGDYDTGTLGIGKRARFALPEKVHNWLLDNSKAVTIDFDTIEKPLMHPGFCRRRRTCLQGGWGCCQHELESSMLLKHGSRVKAATALDDWAYIDLPKSCASAQALVVNDFVYVVGGAVGNQDLFGNYISCKDSVIRANLPFKPNSAWTQMKNLSCARRAHAACVRCDNEKKPIALIVSGGRGTYEQELKGGRLLSSCEILPLQDDVEDTETEWDTQSIELPTTRAAHHMICYQDCLFIFGGRTNTEGNGLTSESKQVRIYDFQTKKWYNGPEHGLAFAGGSSFLVADRWWCVLGGVIGSKFLEFFSVLDLKPWADWVKQGCLPKSRPATTWMRGPDLPGGLPTPNAVYVPRSVSKSPNDWILLVGPNRNYCFGMVLNVRDSVIKNDHLRWLPQGMFLPEPPGSQTGRLFALKWERVGGCPDGFNMSTVVASHQQLVVIGGEHTSYQKPPMLIGPAASNTVFYRPIKRLFPFSTNGSLLPPYNVEQNAVDEVAAATALISEGRYFASNRRELNDKYLVGRMGFPFQYEKQQFLQNDAGVKTLSIVDANEGLSCAMCKDSGDVIQDRAPLYAMNGTKQLVQEGTVIVQKANEKEALKTVCSQCLCRLYYFKPQPQPPAQVKTQSPVSQPDNQEAKTEQ